MAAVGPDIKIDVARILTILVGVGVVGGVGYFAYSTVNKAKENTVYNSASEQGYQSPSAQATRLKNALEVDYIFDWNVNEEEVFAVLSEIKTNAQFKEVAKLYRNLTGQQLLDDLRKVGNNDYLIVEQHLRRIS